MCCWVIVRITSALPGTDTSSSCPRSCHNFTLVSAPLFHEMNTEVNNNCETSLEEGQESNKRSQRTPGSREKAATTEVNTSYCIRYENNASKRWDGKELLVDKSWLDELYPASEIYPGKQIQLPWTGKRGKTVLWNAVVIESDNSQKPSPKKQHVENTKPKQRKQSGKISSKKDKGISIARMQQYRTCMNYIARQFSPKELNNCLLKMHLVYIGYIKLV